MHACVSGHSWNNYSWLPCTPFMRLGASTTQCVNIVSKVHHVIQVDSPGTITGATMYFTLVDREYTAPTRGRRAGGSENEQAMKNPHGFTTEFITQQHSIQFVRQTVGGKSSHQVHPFQSILVCVFSPVFGAP